MTDFLVTLIAFFIALSLSNLLTLLFASRIFAKKAGLNFARGQGEFRNEQEKQYLRKRV